MIESARAAPVPYITIAAVVLLVAAMWMVATTGGTDLLVKEVLGEAYDSQADHLLRGDAGVEADVVRWEAMIVNGKARMYFGPFPALVRIPLNLIYPAGRGAWSRLSGFCAATIALAAFAGLTTIALRRSSLSQRGRDVLGAACLVGFVFGTPLLFLLGNVSIYNEAIIWGFGWSIAALFFLARKDGDSRSTGDLAGFAVCAGFALLARVTFGVALLLIAPLLAFEEARARRFRRLVTLLPIAGATAFYLWLNYARFGSFTETGYRFYINSLHRDFALSHGVFDLKRVPYSFFDYFSVIPPAFKPHPPFVAVDRHPFEYPELFSLPFSESFISAIWSSGWLVLPAAVGVVCLFSRTRVTGSERWIAAALFAQFVVILSYFALAQRYMTDLYPFLIFCFLVFLRTAGAALMRGRYVLIALIIACSAMNFLATAAWLSADRNLPVETQRFWKLGRERSGAN